MNDAAEHEIADGMLRWEPGTLSTRVVERILMDALADLWRDCYRRGDTYHDTFQRNLFREKLMAAIHAATNQRMEVFSK